MKNSKTLSLYAGITFLLLVVGGIYAEFAVRAKLLVWEDPSQTILNISQNSTLFRIGFVADQLMVFCFLVFAWLLYHRFKSTSKTLSGLMLLSVAVSVAIMSLGLINQISILLLIDSNMPMAFNAEQLNTLSMFFAQKHHYTYMNSQLYYGFYLLPLGLLVMKCKETPTWIGIFQILGFAGDFIDYIRFFVAPNYHTVLMDNITIPADIGEFSFLIFLIYYGLKPSKNQQKEAKAINHDLLIKQHETSYS